ncbi:serine/threonine protein kinase [Saprolegnia diclina VS20]|uniref:Serine/threonine protein kinase n=1 Tax=Saprolegnia diclina (strain VS20) TaxID=1156394 RepID=T0QDK6_SAPDV|nr:serine/threonine protein kinase [Saprolegnia diclina VS20]EQC31665.1 serine/threonine protein kinase [Saprolegnia diclina VS20]|eukprot:XP_008615064.1 serine/threonine protein kinase [Saprolegnia diclina VS20]
MLSTPFQNSMAAMPTGFYGHLTGPPLFVSESTYTTAWCDHACFGNASAPSCIWYANGSVSSGGVATTNGLELLGTDASLHVQYLERLPAATTALSLDSVGLVRLQQDLRRDDMGRIVAMSSLLLARNHIATIDGVQFPTQLTTLSLRQNALRSLGAVLAPVLASLDVSLNKLTALTASDMLPTSLQLLNLSGNALQTLASAAFPPILQHLDVANNQVRSLSTVSWPPCLLTLNASNNALTSLSNVSFPETLQQLELGHNAISEIRAAFPKSLRRLCLGPNPVQALYANASQYALLESLGRPADDCLLQVNATSTACAGHYGMALLWGLYPVCLLPDASIISDADAAVFPYAAAIGGGVSLAVLLVIAVVCYVCRRRKRVRMSQSTPIEMDVRSWYSSAQTPTPLERASLHLEAEFRDHFIPQSALTRGHLLYRRELSLVHRALYQAAGADDAEMITLTSLPPDKSDDPDAVGIFLENVRLHAQLHHPKIVRFIGVTWRTVKQLALVTEYMERGDLWSLLQEPPMHAWLDDMSGTGVTKLSLLHDVVDGLRYLHSCDPTVFHMDLKAEHIFVSESFEAKLGAFGSTRATHHAEDVTGTDDEAVVAWSAPEVLKGLRYTEKADIYALGVLIATMDTGKAPFADESNQLRASRTRIAVHVMAGDATLDFRDDCPPAVRSMADRCLSYDPRDRPSAKDVYKWIDFIRKAPLTVPSPEYLI